MTAKQFRLQTTAADNVAQQEKQNLEEVQKEFAEKRGQTTIAMANIQAAAQTSKSNGISLVPVADGNIVHSNIIVPEEMVQAMMAEPTFAMQSMQPDGAAVLVQWALTFNYSKSTKIQAPQPPPQGSNETVGSSKGLGDGQVPAEELSKGQREQRQGLHRQVTP